MICVSIGRGRHRQMIAEYKYLAEHGVKLVELRVDWILRPVNLKRLLAERPVPIIFTCRREKDGGKWNKPENERLVLLRSAIVEGVDYVDLEDDIADSIPRYGKTKRIVSYHNFRETPEDLEAIHARLAKCDPDIVKIATMAHNQHDSLRMLRLVKSAKIPTVGLCMGDIGTPTRILTGRFGSPFTFATLHSDRALAPGQITYNDMVGIYHYNQITPQTEVYGVIADPVAHSLSPRIHNAAFHHLKLNKVYVPFRVPREDLATFLSNCRELGIQGLSVTIPHKEEVMRYLSKVEDAAAQIGAVNTIDFSGPQSVGSNTDCQAALDSIIHTMGKPGPKPLAGVRSLILGSGGVAKAIVHGLIANGASCVVTGRTPERAAELAQRFGASTVDWELRHNSKAELLVNCTPVGMHPNVDDTPFDQRFLSDFGVVFDTIYNPEQTLLIKQARDAGCQVITGVDMFVGQAALQFKIFSGGHNPSLETMRKEIMRAIGPAKM